MAKKLSIKERMRQASAKNVDAAMMSETDFGDPKYIADTGIYMLNFLFSGKFTGPGAGITPGLHMLAGPSKSFKTQIGLHAVKGFTETMEDPFCVFHDTEFGGADSWDALKIDQDLVMHIAIEDVETWKFDLVKRFEELEKSDNVIFFTDSLGMMGSKKETDDAKDEKSVADMSRAKAIKSVLRLTTPRLGKKQIPMVCINHTGIAIGGMFPQEGQTGGQAATLAPNTVVFFGKSKLAGIDEENATNFGLNGFTFKLKLNKSRTLKEGTILMLPVYFGSPGPDKYSGLYEMAEELKIIYSPSKGWRAIDIVDPETGEVTVRKFRERSVRFPIGEDYQEFHEMLTKETDLFKIARQKFVLHFEANDADADGADEDFVPAVDEEMEAAQAEFDSKADE